MSALTQQRTSGYKPLLFLFCLFALGWITMLLYAGGMTTSIKAGMAFLDWPLSNGSVNPRRLADRSQTNWPNTVTAYSA
jgi:cytochrome c oxidase assembly protein subunit 15